jgi:hypothetical protein
MLGVRGGPARQGGGAEVRPLGLLGRGRPPRRHALRAPSLPWSLPRTRTPRTSSCRSPGPRPDGPLGSDKLGRDLFSRLVFGARSSLLSALLVVLPLHERRHPARPPCSLLRGVFDSIVSRALDLLLAFPSLSWPSSRSRLRTGHGERGDRAQRRLRTGRGPIVRRPASWRSTSLRGGRARPRLLGPPRHVPPPPAQPRPPPPRPRCGGLRVRAPGPWQP